MLKKISANRISLKLIIFIFSVFSFFPSLNFAVSKKFTSINPSAEKLLIIPTPQNVMIGKGNFVISKSTRIILTKDSEDDKFSAEQLNDELQNDLKFVIKIEHGSHFPKNIVIGNFSENKRILETLKKSGIQIPDSLNDEGYVLDISSSEIIIAGKTSTGTFYGVQTLKQIIRSNQNGNSIPCLTIIDWPELRYRGWMDDISRGPIPNMDLLKKEVRTMAEYKQNFFNLYTEHVFKLKHYPDIAPEDGLTPQQVKELSEFASKYHIQLIGNFQSFGHMYQILKSPFYSKLGETENILNPADENTYKFLKNVYSEVVPAYDKSNFFNIDCDETFGLGQGKAKALVDSFGLGEVYARHINKIYHLIKPYDKRIMMWGDIAVNNPDIIKELPKDLIILSWGYGPDSSFDNAIIPFTKAGFDFMVAPGVGCWRRIWPAMNDANINISNYVRDGKKLGADGMMNTAWDDDGENLFNYNWYGLIWGAECSWKPLKPASGLIANQERNNRLAEFNHAFDAEFYGNAKANVAKVFLQLDSLRNSPIPNLLNDSGFWDSILDFNSINTSDTALSNNRLAENKISYILGELTELKNIINRNNSTLDYAIFAARRVLFETKKNIFRVELSKETASPSPQFQSSFNQKVDSLVNELHNLKMDYTILWENENRSWWLDHIQARYDKLGDELINLDKKVIIKAGDNVENGERTISLSTLFNNKQIYYTTNGTEPTTGAELYTKPFKLSYPTEIRACVIENSIPSVVSSQYVLVDKAIGKLYKLVSPYSTYNPIYAAGGDSALVDGKLGSLDYADGHWQGFKGNDLNIILDLKKPTQIKKISIRFMQEIGSWIYMPAKIKILFSDDGVNFSNEKDIINPISPSENGTIIHNFSCELDNVNTRYVQVIGVNPGKFPKNTKEARYDSFLFADEIIIE